LFPSFSVRALRPDFDGLLPDYAVNSVLYQRGIYPPEDFEQVRNYGMPMLVSKDREVKSFIERAMSQSSSWLLSNDIQKLVIVVLEVATDTVKERWSFDIDTNADVAAKYDLNPTLPPFLALTFFAASLVNLLVF